MPHKKVCGGNCKCHYEKEKGISIKAVSAIHKLLNFLKKAHYKNLLNVIKIYCTT